VKALKDCRVLVTPTSYGKYDPRLKTELEAAVGEVVYNTTGKPLDAAAVAALLPGMDAYIAGVDQISAAALAAADRLQVISRYGVGVDRLDLEAARGRGIVVTNTPGANSVSVAELTIGLMFALARQIPAAAEQTRQGGWPRLIGAALAGKTVGLVGLGAIGREVARRLCAFDCTILAYDIHPDTRFAEQHCIELVKLPALLGRSDFISLHLPALPETRAFVNQAFLALVKPGAYFINTARGELVDEDALLVSLQSGRLRAAALDCFAQEPPAANSPLLKLENVLPTPHMGAHTDGATDAMGWMSLRDCLAVLRGEEPLYRVA